MARIEKEVAMKDELDAMKKDVVKAVKKGTKSSHPIRSCALLLAIVVFVLGFWFLWSLASTGLVSVPLVSSLAYSVPEPSRTVDPGAPVEDVVETQLASQIEAYGNGGANLSEPLPLSFSVPESALTATLRTAVSDSSSTQIAAERAQVAVVKGEGLEVFLPLANNAKESAITMMLSLQSVDGEVVTSVSSVYIGSYHLPAWLRRSFVDPLVDSGWREMGSRLSSYAVIQSITLQDGSLDVSGTLLEHAIDFPPL